MIYEEAIQIIGEAVENQQANVPAEQLAMACATVLVRTGLLGGVRVERLRIVDESDVAGSEGTGS